MQLTSSFMPAAGLLTGGAGSLNVLAAAHFVSNDFAGLPVVSISGERVTTGGITTSLTPSSIIWSSSNSIIWSSSIISTQGLVNSAKALRVADIAVSDTELSMRHELTLALSGTMGVNEVGTVIGNHLRILIPFTLCVAFLYDPAADELLAASAMGEGASLVIGLKIALGQRISGWVAANRYTIVNSDPALDLGEIARTVSPRLRNCLSAPVLSGDQLVAVVTLYSASSQAFTDKHRRTLEAVAREGMGVHDGIANKAERAKGPRPVYGGTSSPE